MNGNDKVDPYYNDVSFNYNNVDNKDSDTFGNLTLKDIVSDLGLSNSEAIILGELYNGPRYKEQLEEKLDRAKTYSPKRIASSVSAINKKSRAVYGKDLINSFNDPDDNGIHKWFISGKDPRKSIDSSFDEVKKVANKIFDRQCETCIYKASSKNNFIFFTVSVILGMIIGGAIVMFLVEPQVIVDYSNIPTPYEKYGCK